jgi:hypothetical protein
MKSKIILAKKLFGMLSKWEKPTDEIKEDMKKGWNYKFF